MKNPNGKTSQDVPKAGLYVSDCCNIEKAFEARAVFQRCPECERLTKWEFVMPVKGMVA